MHFGLGGRQCIGKTVATTNIYKLFSTILREFTFELANEWERIDAEKGLYKGKIPDLVSVGNEKLSMAPTPSKTRLYTRREIEALIANNAKIIILDGEVIKADAWIPYHPGGEKAILHLVGRDGTDEIRALHSREAQARMRKFVIGRIEGRWENFLPPIQGGFFRKLGEDGDGHEQIEDEKGVATELPPAIGTKVKPKLNGNALEHAKTVEASTAHAISSDMTNYPPLDQESQDTIIQKYRQLDARLRAEGLYDCPYGSYAIEGLRCIALFTLFLTCLHYAYYTLAGLFLGLFWHQLLFTGHDAGHMGITHNFHIDTCIGIFIGDFLGGLSIGWWKRNHNVHHIVTNSPAHDPDIEHLPFFAISSDFFNSLYSSYYDRALPFDAAARLFVKYQHWLYYPILALGRFNLYFLAWSYLVSPTQVVKRGPAWWHRYVEIAGLVFFWYWFGYRTIYLSIPSWSSRVTFLLVSHVATAPLHVQLTLSHFAMSTDTANTSISISGKLHESFPQRMLRATMDVDCPPWLDFFHGGLQFQVVHHLFPRLPRHNLRKAQKHVREFCADVGIPYVIFGFGRGNQEVIGRLGEVAEQWRVWEECRKVAARELVEGYQR
ncbi:Fatty acid desaturase [Aspergillus mulundensis]|uniref:Delta 8-(E)-sphingolipid desaturase n=1 Tax=Aspergillus mulundensis TaxID=1810919 RepID=A0A3D8SW00_9EURO|nr:Fatty acid desaturase [Aspergillus mulundensis]RDW89968.1 Fatty acid desaturase [Aspergillus mulundensis]